MDAPICLTSRCGHGGSVFIRPRQCSHAQARSRRRRSVRLQHTRERRTAVHPSSVRSRSNAYRQREGRVRALAPPASSRRTSRRFSERGGASEFGRDSRETNRAHFPENEIHADKIRVADLTGWYYVSPNQGRLRRPVLLWALRFSLGRATHRRRLGDVSSRLQR